MGQRTPTETLSHRLRLMADAGGVLTRDRKRTCIEAADRLDEYMWAHPDLSTTQHDTGGDTHEEH